MILLSLNWDAIESIATVAGTILALVAAYSAYREIKVGADNSRGEFILNLQQEYTDKSAYADLFEECWKNYCGERTNKELRAYLETHEKDVLNYLTFFESMYLMISEDVLEMKTLDELFGRRFMIVVSNKTVQEFDLVTNKKYYRNDFLLYNCWKKFRLENGNEELFLNDEKRYCDLAIYSDENKKRL